MWRLLVSLGLPSTPGGSMPILTGRQTNMSDKTGSSIEDTPSAAPPTAFQHPIAAKPDARISRGKRTTGSGITRARCRHFLYFAVPNPAPWCVTNIDPGPGVCMQGSKSGARAKRVPPSHEQ